ncbi:hypothetical protein OESDEN_23424, partial [Oesophagostomum dentatum]
MGWKSRAFRSSEIWSFFCGHEQWSSFENSRREISGRYKRSSGTWQKGVRKVGTYSKDEWRHQVSLDR